MMAPHAYEKQEVGKPSRNAAQPCAVYHDPYGGDELRDGWAFRVGTWNVGRKAQGENFGIEDGLRGPITKCFLGICPSYREAWGRKGVILR